MAKNKSIDLQLSEVDLQALESIGVISVQNNMETGSSNSNANFRRAISGSSVKCVDACRVERIALT
ncbi:hypothetical protein ST42_12225 [Prevotella pectinovora]|nr:hypothetical protein ST42_12225 [Prevotella pectinovora]